MWKQIKSATDTNPDQFPILKNLTYHETYEVTGTADLEQLRGETEHMPGEDDDFRRAVGFIHGAAAHSWASSHTLSFLGKAEFVY